MYVYHVHLLEVSEEVLVNKERAVVLPSLTPIQDHAPPRDNYGYPLEHSSSWDYGQILTLPFARHSYQTLRLTATVMVPPSLHEHLVGV